jgi:hypothetical protein
MKLWKSFQHENVFGSDLTGVYSVYSYFYINLTFEVKLQAQN